MAYRLEVVVQLIDQRLTRRDIDAEDGGIRDGIQMLDKGAQAVAVSGHQRTPSRTKRRSNRSVLERDDAINGIRKTPGSRQILGNQPGITVVETGRARRI